MLINLGLPADWAGQQIFSDLMLTARAPGSPDAPWDEKFGKVGANVGVTRWPLEDFGIVVATRQLGHLAGKYLLGFNGSADVSAILSAGVSVSPSISPPPSRQIMTVQCTGETDQLMLRFRNAKGVSNVMLTGVNESGIWKGATKTMLSPFSGFRMMDLQATNNSPQVAWTDRPSPGDAPKNALPNPSRGVPLEILIGLCKEANADGWFCAPHAANDDYLRQMANLFKQRWTHGRTLFLQYSNEAGWNNNFAVQGWLKQKFPGADGNGDWDAIKAYIATRTADIGDAFRAAGVPNVVTVLCGQFTNPDWILSGLDALHKVGRFGSIQAIAGASYVTQASDIPAHQAMYDNYRRIAGSAGLKFMLYELGIEQATLAASRDTDAGAALVSALVNAWRAGDPDGVAAWYCFGGGGFGAVIYGDAPTAVFRAVAAAAAGATNAPPRTDIKNIVINYLDGTSRTLVAQPA